MTRIRYRWLRWLLRLLLFGGALLLVAFAAAAWSVRRAADAGRLDDSEWSRLRSELARNLVARRDRDRTPPPSADSPPPVDLPADEESEAPSPAVPPVDAMVLARQAEEYRARQSKTVVELQQFRRETSMQVSREDGSSDIATLINLNPTINAWYLLTLAGADGATTAFHLANNRPATQTLDLDAAHAEGVMLVEAGRRRPCALFSASASEALAAAVSARTPYLDLCDGAVTLRLKTPGHRTAKEWTTDFLRDNVWGGERLTVFVRRTLYKDAFLSTADPESAAAGPARPRAEPSSTPPAAHIDPRHAGTLLVPTELGLGLEATDGGRVRVGEWYRLRDNPGIFASVVQPAQVAPEILQSYPGVTAPLDEVESRALTFLVAFDLQRFDLGFSVGTDHPRVGWSERINADMRDDRLPGPDGIGDLSPLVATGVIPAAQAARTVATFTGGFKRGHGAFRAGRLATVNHGSHYGFIENGVVLSKLQPGLSTLFVLADGRVELKTWSEEDDVSLERLRFARQNGLPIVEPDPQTGRPRPGALVARWGEGNWSGSQDKKFRTLRAGACLLESEAGRFLVYAYFSSATPSAMARVFQAYDCHYAMLLDMNALEHTYLAVYRARDGRLDVEHLVTGMNVLDKTVDGTLLPRFLGFADNRDFFYVTLREEWRPPLGARAPLVE